MTKKSLGTLALCASLFAADTLLAQSGASKSSSPTVTVPSTAPAPKTQKLIQVCRLDSIQANQEFQKNVQIMQAERQQAIEANAAYEKETDTTKKKDLKAKADALLAKLNEDNQKMFKAYGFSLERNYTLVVETARVYMLVTDEEAAAFEKTQKEQAEKAEKESAAKKK